MMDTIRNNFFTSPQDIPAFLSNIENVFHISLYKNDVQRTALYDTFDGRLCNENLMLLLADTSALILKNLCSGHVLFKEPVRTRTMPVFWWDFHKSEIKSVLKKIIDIRALMKLAELEDISSSYNIVNNEGVTIAGICLKKISRIDGPESNRHQDFLEVIPLKDHDSELNIIHDMIFQLNIEPLTEDPHMVYLKKTGIEPGKYTSKINVDLRPDEQCNNAMKKILEQTLAVVKQNITGIKNDTDTEFLHDFRVAIRRTRSAATQIPGVFSKELCSGFVKDLKYFGQSSNRLRDIDVYLLNRDYYLKILPQELRPGLKPFFNSLQKKRKLELQDFTNNLNSDRYHRLITKWESLLNAESDMNITLSNAARPVIDVAKQYISRMYNKIIKTANKIDEAKSAKTLHSLRIQCKKLRYLLEFFISLFPKKDIDPFIKKLKKMQDNLGEFNDLIVQQHELNKHLSRIDLKSKKRIIEAAAIGGLMSVFKYKQTIIRNGFKAIFEEFINKENTELFNKLFN